MLAHRGTESTRVARRVAALAKRAPPAEGKTAEGKTAEGKKKVKKVKKVKTLARLAKPCIAPDLRRWVSLPERDPPFPPDDAQLRALPAGQESGCRRCTSCIKAALQEIDQPRNERQIPAFNPKYVQDVYPSCPCAWPWHVWLWMCKQEQRPMRCTCARLAPCIPCCQKQPNAASPHFDTARCPALSYCAFIYMLMIIALLWNWGLQENHSTTQSNPLGLNKMHWSPVVSSIQEEYLLSATSSAPEFFVKTLYVEHLEDDASEQLAKEMALLKRLRHVNILPFVGAANFQDGDVWQFDLVFKGNHLERKGGTDGVMLEPLASILTMNSKVHLFDLLDIGFQVANALEWLHSPSKVGGSIVHGNINWSSVLVGKSYSDGASSSLPRGEGKTNAALLPALSSARSLHRRTTWTVKVSSLCLSLIDGCAYDEDAVYEEDQNMPAWVAPEIHLGNECTVASDVYSYGILLWCLMTRRSPFEGVSGRKIGQAVLSKKARPEYTFDELTRLPFQNDYMALMTSCWDNAPSLRPPMRKACTQMNAFSRMMRTLNTLSATWKARSANKLAGIVEKDVVASNEIALSESETNGETNPFAGMAEVEMTSLD